MYWYFTVRNFSPSPNPQAEGPPLVGCQRLLIQYIRSYTSYLEAVSFNQNPMSRHTVLTRTSLTWDEIFWWKDRHYVQILLLLLLLLLLKWLYSPMRTFASLMDFSQLSLTIDLTVPRPHLRFPNCWLFPGWGRSPTPNPQPGVHILYNLCKN
jgi:hypothetical protein